MKTLKKLWIYFGKTMHRVTNPIVLSLLFFGIITPFGMTRKALGMSSMQIGYDPSATTYWEKKLARKRNWSLLPLLFILFVFGLLLILSEIPLIAPFIYTLF
jgi:hypothetical protein